MTPSAHDLTTTQFCKHPGCEKEAKATAGVYALLCDQHADEKRKQRDSLRTSPTSPAAGRNVQQLTELIQLAKDADKLEHRATQLAQQAREATRAALTARQRYQAAVRATLDDTRTAA